MLLYNLSMKKTIFYISDFYCADSPEDIDISDIPPLLRRKLSPVDKACLSACNKIFRDDIEEFVFSSAYGEITRLDSIISQYKEFNEVSPAQFSGSVHNYPAGFFTLYKKLNIPYYAAASGENSVSAGLIKAVLSKRNNVLFCYADDLAAACIINKNQGKIKCTFSHQSENNNDEFRSFSDFLKGKTKTFKTLFGSFERIEE